MNTDLIETEPEKKSNIVYLLSYLINLTDNAKKRIKYLMEQHKFSSGDYLRVGVLGGGCSGFQYKLSFVNCCEDEDITIFNDGINIIVNNKAMTIISGLEIDYDESLGGKGWIYNNPNATGSCGCGSSFSC